MGIFVLRETITALVFGGLTSCYVHEHIQKACLNLTGVPHNLHNQDNDIKNRQMPLEPWPPAYMCMHICLSKKGD